ncbi:MAG TPA: TrkA C-terminal domain-containing protein, partial [Phycisphaerae bacterium]|nr:TrkA C-terminal domain-containing protein [Phycisphaerae bacterium]
RQLRPDIQVIVRAQHATSEDKLLKAGANRVICPGVMGAMRMSDIIVRPALVDFVDMAHKGVELGMEQLEVRGDSPLVGKTLAELALRRHAGVLVVAVRRAGGEAIYTPGSDFRLQAGDTLVLVGARGAAEAIERLQPPGADQT